MRSTGALPRHPQRPDARNPLVAIAPLLATPLTPDDRGDPKRGRHLRRGDRGEVDVVELHENGNVRAGVDAPDYHTIERFVAEVAGKRSLSVHRGPIMHNLRAQIELCLWAVVGKHGEAAHRFIELDIDGRIVP